VLSLVRRVRHPSIGSDVFFGKGGSNPTSYLNGGMVTTCPLLFEEGESLCL